VSFDLAVSAARSRKSVALHEQTCAHKPFKQAAVAEAAIKLDSIETLIERVAAQWWQGCAEDEPWIAKFLSSSAWYMRCSVKTKVTLMGKRDDNRPSCIG